MNASAPVTELHLLPPEWYLSEDVVALARSLLGKVITTSIDGIDTAAYITETEAYRGPEDRASHAWSNRRTARTEVMFHSGGVAYVYLCYGIHHLFNVVTGPADVPHAILIRAVQSIQGEEHMLNRRSLLKPRRNWLTGPGSAARALGITTKHSGLLLADPLSPLQIRDAGVTVAPTDIITGPRIGVDYAGEDAMLPWRFHVNSVFPQQKHRSTHR